jgi:hypothetical protein
MVKKELAVSERPQVRLLSGPNQQQQAGSLEPTLGNRRQHTASHC